MTRLRLAAAALLAVAALSSCSTSVTDLEVGQCVKTFDTSEEVSSLPVVPCTESHVGEVYFLQDLPDGDYPGEEAVQASAEELCGGPAFTDYVGVAYDDSTVYNTSLYPQESGWNAGDHEIACVLTSDQNRTPSTGSLRGANR